MHKEFAQIAVEIVQDAGGKLVGRTRIQKIGYLLEACGFEENLQYVYKHYGPYSESLSTGILNAGLVGVLEEIEQQASWGGTYSVFKTPTTSGAKVSKERLSLIKEAANADSVELELAATALFLFKSGFPTSAWEETARRKPDKIVNGRIEKAKLLYNKLSKIECPNPLPSF